jgi:hypothetical protein
LAFGKTEIFFLEGLDKETGRTVADLPVGLNMNGGASD